MPSSTTLAVSMATAYLLLFFCVLSGQAAYPIVLFVKAITSILFGTSAIAVVIGFTMAPVIYVVLEYTGLLTEKRKRMEWEDVPYTLVVLGTCGLIPLFISTLMMEGLNLLWFKTGF